MSLAADAADAADQAGRARREAKRASTSDDVAAALVRLAKAVEALAQAVGRDAGAR
jgi:hypothetical protein